MKDPWLITGLLTGAFFVIIYVVTRKKRELNNIAHILLSCSGLTGGVKLCYLVIFSDCFRNTGVELVYIFLGGVCTIFVMCSTTYKAFVKSTIQADKTQ